MYLVSNWDEIKGNIREFKHLDKDKGSITFRRFGYFYHWYYLPSDDLFGPSKFIGYKGTTISDYRGCGHGGETCLALKEFFVPVDKNSSQFRDLKDRLDKFAASLGKKICVKTYQGTGGIYYPKLSFL